MIATHMYCHISKVSIFQEISVSTVVAECVRNFVPFNMCGNRNVTYTAAANI